MFKTDKDIPPQRHQILQTFVLRGNKLAPTKPPPYQRLQFLAALQSYIFARFTRITLKLGKFTYFQTFFFPVVAHVKS